MAGSVHPDYTTVKAARDADQKAFDMLDGDIAQLTAQQTVLTDKIAKHNAALSWMETEYPEES